MERVTVSSDYLIEVPVDIREKLQIEPGDSLQVQVRDGSIVLVPESGSYSKRLRGLHGEIWRGIDPVEYVASLRADKDE